MFNFSLKTDDGKLQNFELELTKKSEFFEIFMDF